MAEDRPDPHHPPSQTPPDHELTGMETFFDNLFNQHMVLPQPPEGLSPIDGVEEHDDRADEGVGPTGGAG